MKNFMLPNNWLDHTFSLRSPFTRCAGEYFSRSTFSYWKTLGILDWIILSLWSPFTWCASQYKTIWHVTAGKHFIAGGQSSLMLLCPTKLCIKEGSQGWSPWCTCFTVWTVEQAVTFQCFPSEFSMTIRRVSVTCPTIFRRIPVACPSSFDSISIGFDATTTFFDRILNNFRVDVRPTFDELPSHVRPVFDSFRLQLRPFSIGMEQNSSWWSTWTPLWRTTTTTTWYTSSPRWRSLLGQC